MSGAGCIGIGCTTRGADVSVKPYGVPLCVNCRAKVDSGTCAPAGPEADWDAIERLLQRITDPQCGCVPVCVCGSPEARLSFAEHAQEVAREALAGIRSLRPAGVQPPECAHRWIVRTRGGDPAEPGSAEGVCFCWLCGVEYDEERHGASQTPTARSARDVLAEREKQRAKWGDAHDDEHSLGELRNIAAFLIRYSRTPRPIGPGLRSADEWSLLDKHDERGRLVIAAALLIAEIDRLDRAAARVTQKAGAS